MTEFNPHTLKVDREQAVAIFSTAEIIDPEARQGEVFSTRAGVQLQFVDTRLGLYEDPEHSGEQFYVPGNTVPRLCPNRLVQELGNCTATVCGLGDKPMWDWQRQIEDCAVANTVLAFNGRPGYVFTPTNNEVRFLADDASSKDVMLLNESGEFKKAFGKIEPGSVLVISEHDIPAADAENGVYVGLNGADNSLGVATLQVEGDRYALVFSSTRLNLGDRDEDAQILRKAIDGILDWHDLRGEDRAAAIQGLEVQIDVGYSATVDQFAFDIHIPSYEPPAELQGTDMRQLTDEQVGKLSATSKNARHILMTNDHLAEDGSIKEGEAGQITPSEFMNFWYPGALRNGEVIGHPEVELGLYTPRTEAGCPGDGELCHVDYAKITQRTLKTQLVEMGIPESSIVYDLSRLTSTSSPDNYLASNRVMELAGVPLNQTLRSMNGVTIAFPDSLTLNGS